MNLSLHTESCFSELIQFSKLNRQMVISWLLLHAMDEKEFEMLWIPFHAPQHKKETNFKGGEYLKREEHHVWANFHEPCIQRWNDACYQGLKLVSPIYRGSDAWIHPTRVCIFGGHAPISVEPFIVHWIAFVSCYYALKGKDTVPVTA